jgi:hypothetical protein
VHDTCLHDSKQEYEGCTLDPKKTAGVRNYALPLLNITRKWHLVIEIWLRDQDSNLGPND